MKNTAAAEPPPRGCRGAGRHAPRKGAQGRNAPSKTKAQPKGHTEIKGRASDPSPAEPPRTRPPQPARAQAVTATDSPRDETTPENQRAHTPAPRAGTRAQAMTQGAALGAQVV